MQPTVSKVSADTLRSRKAPLIKLLVSADYELFHGTNFFDDETVLFQPTLRLLNLGSELQVPITLFADVCSVWAHRREKLDDFSAKFEDQLRLAVRQGHDVQLHIHPHWAVSVHENGHWRLSTEKVHLSEFEDPGSIIRRGHVYLTSLLQPEKPDYACIAFRAGGLALQPGEDVLLRVLADCNVAVDSSIAKGYQLKMDTISVDYTDMPKRANWFIGERSGLRSNSTGELFEVPIATFQMRLGQRVRFLVKRALSVRQRKGAGISRSLAQSRIDALKSLIMANLRYLKHDPVFLFSVDTKGLNADMLVRGFEQYVQQHASEEVIYTSMIMHPKLMFDQQFDMLENVIRRLRAAYADRLEFVAFPAICAELPTIASRATSPYQSEL